MKWVGIDFDAIEVTRPKGVPKFNGLRFQIPRGLCRYGHSEYKTISVELGNRAFVNWWRDMEQKMGDMQPFNSNLKDNTLRIKVGDDVPVFDERRNYIGLVAGTGYGAGKQMSCLVEIPGMYYFNDQYGFIVRCVQVMLYDDPPSPEDGEQNAAVKPCALLDSDDETAAPGTS